MDEMERFHALDQQAEELVDQLGKDEIVQCARLLALHVADYRRRFGPIEHDDGVGLLAMTEMGATPERAERLADAAKILLDRLVAVRDGNCGAFRPH